MIFERYGYALGKTWAFRLFKRHHTELNNLYWSYAQAAHYAGRANALAAPQERPHELFHYRDAGRKVQSDRALWKASFGSFDNWVRLSALMSMSGYLEIYLKKVVTVALESDPGVQFGRSRAIDGFTFWKHHPKYSLAIEAEACVKGDWNQRVSRFDELFGHVPKPLSAAVGELELMRRLRNGVGHAFGRDTNEYSEHFHTAPRSMGRLSEERLKKWLGIIEEVATAVDQHLGPAHIGQYEMLCYYHSWSAEPRNVGTGTRGFRRALYRKIGHSMGTEFVNGLIEYYANV
jgi:hypothetical protein